MIDDLGKRLILHCFLKNYDSRENFTSESKKSVWYKEENINVWGWKCKCDIVLFSTETFCDDNQARQRWEQETQDVVYKKGKGKCLISHDIRQENNFSCSFGLEVEET